MNKVINTPYKNTIKLLTEGCKLSRILTHREIIGIFDICENQEINKIKTLSESYELYLSDERKLMDLYISYKLNKTITFRSHLKKRKKPLDYYNYSLICNNGNSISIHSSPHTLSHGEHSYEVWLPTPEPLWDIYLVITTPPRKPRFYIYAFVHPPMIQELINEWGGIKTQ